MLLILRPFCCCLCKKYNRVSLLRDLNRILIDEQLEWKKLPEQFLQVTSLRFLIYNIPAFFFLRLLPPLLLESCTLLLHKLNRLHEEACAVSTVGSVIWGTAEAHFDVFNLCCFSPYSGKWSAADRSAPGQGDLCVNWGECWTDYNLHCAPFDLCTYLRLIPVQHIEPCTKQLSPLSMATRYYMRDCHLFSLYVCLKWNTDNSPLHCCILFSKICFVHCKFYFLPTGSKVKCCQCGCNSFAVVWGVKFAWLFLLKDLEGGR